MKGSLAVTKSDDGFHMEYLVQGQKFSPVGGESLVFIVSHETEASEGARELCEELRRMAREEAQRLGIEKINGL